MTFGDNKWIVTLVLLESWLWRCWRWCNLSSFSLLKLLLSLCYLLLLLLLLLPSQSFSLHRSKKSLHICTGTAVVFNLCSIMLSGWLDRNDWIHYFWPWYSAFVYNPHIFGFSVPASDVLALICPWVYSNNVNAARMDTGGSANALWVEQNVKIQTLKQDDVPGWEASAKTAADRYDLQ